MPYPRPAPRPSTSAPTSPLSWKWSRRPLKDLVNLQPYFSALTPGRFQAIILDAFYRFLPRNTDENDNCSMASLYNYFGR